MNHELKHVLVCVGAALGTFAPLAGHAAPASLDTEARVMNQDATAGGEARVSQHLNADFAAWAGSDDNADALVQGLRHGTAITLTGSAGETVKFTPPTRPMGYGNVYISLALAKARLAAQGIADPTPRQLQAALTGSASGQASAGVLQMRSGGMGWGRIAQTYDLKLGPVMAGLKSAHQSFVATAPEPRFAAPVTTFDERAGASEHTSSRGIVSAAGSVSAATGTHDFQGAGGSFGAGATISSPAAHGIVNAGGGIGLGGGGGLARGHFK